MHSANIVLLALVTILAGAAALRYQATGKRRFELFLIAFGVATMASGLAMFRDGVAGSRAFLWMLPEPPAATAQQERSGDAFAHAPAPVTRAALD
jgi:hypothetical protein